MQAGIRISSLVPSGLVIESVSDSSDSIILAVRSEAGMAECPLCGSRSRRIHSRYDRQVVDLPCAVKPIRLRVITRRLVCEVPHCRRRISLNGSGTMFSPPGRAPDGTAGTHRPPFGVGTQRQTSSELRQAADAAGQQRYVASGCTTADSPTNRSSDRRRRRRLGLSTQSPLRNDCLRSRAAADRNPASRSRGRDSSSVARRSSRDQGRIARPWRRLRRGLGKGAP